MPVCSPLGVVWRYCVAVHVHGRSAKICSARETGLVCRNSPFHLTVVCQTFCVDTIAFHWKRFVRRDICTGWFDIELADTTDAMCVVLITSSWHLILK